MAVKHPSFGRPNRSINARVKDNWRKPHGIDSKQRQKIKWAGAIPNKGYKGEKSKANLHPQGKKEIYIRSLGEFEKYKKDLGNFVIRMQRTLSKRNKEIIRRKAAELKLKVLN
jgi:large subunit ribosomal protein L32e